MKIISDDQILQCFIRAIETTPPRPHHSALLAASAKALPDCAFNHVLSKGGWHRAGGMRGADGSQLSNNLEAWVNAELEKCNDDFGQFVQRYAGAGLLVTRHIGRTHYFVASYGPAPEDFLQLEVEELQEVLDRKLIDPEQPPHDRTELVEPATYVKLEAHPVGSPYYRFIRLIDVSEVLAREHAQSGGVSSLARFMSDWSQSRAANRSHFCEHWLIAGLERYSPDASIPFSATPMSVHARTLKPFQWDNTKAGVELGNQIRDFDRAAGYPGAWYFHFITSKFVPDTLAIDLKRDLDSGYQYLADKERGLLEKLVANPYRLNPVSDTQNRRYAIKGSVTSTDYYIC